MPNYCKWVIGFLVLINYTHITLAYDATLVTPNLVLKSKKVVVGGDTGFVYKDNALHLGGGEGGIREIKNVYTATCDHTMVYTEKALKEAFSASYNAYLVDDVIPSGAVVAWLSSGDPPTGWLLCDGRSYTTSDGTTGYTPSLNAAQSSDLSTTIQRFIVCTASGNMPENTVTDTFSGLGNRRSKTGGADSTTFTESTFPSHSHNFRSSSAGGSSGGDWIAGGANIGFIAGSSGIAEKTSAVNNMSTSGYSSAHTNLPPLFAVVYIMKKY